MISGCAARSASWAASWLPEAIASSTLRTKVLIRERRALLIAVRRSVWRSRFFDCGVLAMPAPLPSGVMRSRADSASARFRQWRMRAANAGCARASPDSGSLALAARTIKGRSARLHDARYDPAALRAGARRILAPIDAEFMLEIAELAIRMPVIAKGRPAGGDRIRERRADLRHQRL